MCVCLRGQTDHEHEDDLNVCVCLRGQTDHEHDDDLNTISDV